MTPKIRSLLFLHQQFVWQTVVMITCVCEGCRTSKQRWALTTECTREEMRKLQRVVDAFEWWCARASALTRLNDPECWRRYRYWLNRQSLLQQQRRLLLAAAAQRCHWSYVSHPRLKIREVRNRKLHHYKWGYDGSQKLSLSGRATSKRGIQCESKKIPPLRLSEFFSFFHKRLRIFNRLFTHPLYVLIYARLQIVMQLSPILTKLCHIKRDNLVHIICTKCPKRAKTLAFRRLRKSLIALLIVVCGKSL